MDGLFDWKGLGCFLLVVVFLFVASAIVLSVYGDIIFP